MADNKGGSSKSMRMKAHLRHKGLIKYITPKFPSHSLEPPPMPEMQLEAVVTPDNEENPYEIWNLCDMSTREYSRTLFTICTKCLRKSLWSHSLSEDMYNIVENIILNGVIVKRPSATLIKLQEIVHLEESWKKRTVLSSKTTEKSSKDQSNTAAALMHESKKGKKKATSHDADHCWQLHPKIRPSNG
ncbi:uncharacterized protein VP01_3983g2 [Puccinia sorghi]|uniref:Uncharacterized protein n=1 Tax=Puccinia sorghi TaxID=27349 RepID=A0A0L6US59_9BASI|nr:uncharacterized protein VP01_3983g2 [Puccinia sorghi]